MKIKKLCLLLAGLTLLPTAYAQPLEEIVVTASLRAETQLEAPTSLTVLGAEAIAQSGEQHFEELMPLVPNLNWSAGSSRPRYFQIRGIGERSQYQGAPNPSVGFVVDDIDFSSIGMVATLFDTEQIEVLRGPHGTRYGANALAGLINVRTRAPEGTFGGHVQLGLGSDDIFEAGVAVGGPLQSGAAGDNKTSYRLVLHKYEGGGFRRNVFLNADDTNGRDELTARLKINTEPTENLSLAMTLLHANLDNGYDAFTIDNDLTTETDDPGKDSQESTAAAVRAEWTGSERFDLLSITTWATSDIEASFDGDWGNDDFWAARAPGFGEYDFTSATLRDRDTWSQEFRLVSKPGGELFGDTEWLVGAYLLNLEEDNRVNDLFNGFLFNNLVSEYEATNVALFGQLDKPLGPDMDLTFGLRVEHRSADYRDTGGIDADPNETMVGGHLSLSRWLGENRRVYVSASRGYKAGGFNIGTNIPSDRVEFDAEFLWNLEVGLKGQFLDGRLNAGVSVFYAWRDDQQVNTSFQSDPTDPLTFVFFTDNAASGTNYGLEAEFNWQVHSRVNVFGSLGLLETELDDYVAGTRVLDGREQAHAPGYTYAIGMNVGGPDGWYGRIDLAGKDAFFFSDSHDQRSESYDLLNARVGYAAGSWEVFAWGRNLTDESYATRGFFFGNEPPNFPDTLYIQRGAPRHYGVTARFNF